MLREIEDPARAEAFVEARLGARAALSQHERADPRARIPGFGHRVYKVDDARARVIRGMAKSMADATGRPRLFEVAERVYDACRRGRTCPSTSTSSPRSSTTRWGFRPTSARRSSRWAASRVVRACARAIRGQPSRSARADYAGPAPRLVARPWRRPAPPSSRPRAPAARRSSCQRRPKAAGEAVFRTLSRCRGAVLPQMGRSPPPAGREGSASAKPFFLQRQDVAEAAGTAVALGRIAGPRRARSRRRGRGRGR